MNEQELLDNLKQKKETYRGEARTGSLEEYRETIQATRKQGRELKPGEIKSGQGHQGHPM